MTAASHPRDGVETVDLAGVRAVLRPGPGPGTAVVLPGIDYPPAAPLLWYSRRILQARGWSVLEVWEEPEGGDWADGVLAAAADRIGSAPVLVVAKDVSCNAVPGALARGLPGVWIGPDLTKPDIAGSLSEASVPTLVVGTSTDDTWQVAVAARIRRAEILQMSEPDPSFEIPGDIDRSMAVVGRVMGRVEALVRRVSASG